MLDRGRFVVAIALVAGCGRDPAKQAGPNPDVIAGELTVDGRPVALSACRAGHAVHVYVELVTSGGVLRFEDQQLYWQPDLAAVSAGRLVACDKLDRTWG